MSFPGIFLFLACLPTALLDFAVTQWKTDSKMEMQDAYKWLHQATQGGEHAAPDADSARKWLEREWSNLDLTQRKELMWEPLCPDGSIGRLNLRSYKANGGNPDDLLSAFLNSARKYSGETVDFASAWSELGARLARRSIGKLKHKDWKILDEQTRVKDYPAVHHSERFAAAYRPAYRVLNESDMLKLSAKLRNR